MEKLTQNIARVRHGHEKSLAVSYMMKQQVKSSHGTEEGLRIVIHVKTINLRRSLGSALSSFPPTFVLIFLTYA